MVTDIKNWSTTAGSNTSVGGVSIAEGMAPSNVNNAMRATNAAVRDWYENADWVDFGDSPTYASSTTFTISGDVTARYHANRRIRATDATTLYGTISSSSYSAPDTTVTVTLDSGSLSASLTAVAIGASKNNDALPRNVFAAAGANSDITSLSGLTTALSTGQGGTGLTSLGTAGQVLTVNSGATALEYSDASTDAADLAATALSYALATNDATSITGSVGAFYLSDDFETDSLATKTNATYDATYDYYHAPNALQEDDQNECTSTTGFSGTSLSAVTVDSRSAIKSAHPGNGGGISMYSPALTPGSQTVIVWEFAAKWILRNGTDNGRQGWAIKVPGVSKWINSSTSTYQQPSSNTWYTYKIVYDTVADQVDMYLDGVQKWSAVAASTSGDASIASGGVTLSNSVDNGNSGVYNDIYLDRVAIGYEASPNMTLAPTAASLTTADPNDLTAYITFEPVDSVTAGTDIVMTASIDGGTTDATGTWTLVGNVGASNKLYRIDFDVSAQSGSSLIYEITTANNKNLRVHNVVGIRALY